MRSRVNAETLAAYARLSAPLPNRMKFADRGLSDRTIDALLGAGIQAPERLLFMSANDVAAIKGIGKAALAEIRSYVADHRPD